jgi:hypothetical protein
MCGKKRPMALVLRGIGERAGWPQPPGLLKKFSPFEIQKEQKQERP